MKTKTTVNAMKTIEGAEVVGLVQQTYDYAKFKFHPKNRNVDYGNVNNIRKSMEIKNLFNPILVNEKLEIIDGQHRFEAWKQLGLPIWFIVVEGSDEKDMQTINLYKVNWGHVEYLEYYIKENISSYIKFKELIDKYKVNYSDLINAIDLMSEKPIGEKEMFKLFDEGKLFVETYDKIEDFLKELSLFDKYSFSRETGFVKAFFKLYMEDFYDGEYLKYRIDICDVKLQQLKESTIFEYATFIAKTLYTSPSRGVRIVYDEFSKTYYILSDKKGRPRIA